MSNFGTDVGTAIAKLTLDIAGFQTGMATALTEVEGFGGKLESALNRVSTSLTSIGTSMTQKVTVPIATALGVATKKYADFSGGLQEAGTIMGATSEDMENLKNTAYDVAKSSIFTTKDTAEAYKYMAMAGWDANEATSALAAIMSLAAISGEDLGIVSDIVTDDLTAFGMSADQASHFANVLAEVSMDTNTNVGLMGEAFKYVGPLAGTLGYSIEDVSVAMGLMASSSIKGSTAGTGLRQALTSLVNPSKEASKLMVQLGLATQEYVNVVDDSKVNKAQAALEKKVLDLEKAQIKYNDAVNKYGAESSQAAKAMIDVEKKTIDVEQAQEKLNITMQGTMEEGARYNTLMFDQAGNSKSFLEVLRTLRETFKGLTDEQKASYAETLFGQRAMAAMLTVLEATDEEFNELTDSLYNARDAEEVANDMLDSLKGTMEKFKSSLDVLLTRLGEAFAPIIEKIIKHLTSLMDKMIAMSDEELRHVVNIGLIVAAIGPALVIFGKLVGAVGNVVGAFNKVGSAFSSFGSKVANVGTTVNAAAKSFGTLAGEALKLVATAAVILAAAKAIQMLVDAAMELYNAGPGAIATFAGLTAAAIAITAAIAAIGSACTATAAGLLALGATVAMISAGIAAVVLAISKLVEAFGTLATKLPLISQYGLTAAEAIYALGAACTTAAIPIVAIDVALAAFSLTATLATPLMLALSAALEAFSLALESLSKAMEACAKAFEITWNVISKVVSEAVDLILELVRKLTFGIIDLFSDLKYRLIGDPIVIDLVNGVIKAFLEMAKKVVEFVKDLVVKVIEFFKNLYNNIKEMIKNIMSNLSELGNHILNWISKIINKVKEFINSMFSMLKEFFSNLISIFTETIKNIWNKIQEFFNNIKRRAEEFIANAKAKLKEFFTFILNKIKEAYEKIKSTLEEIYNKIIDFIKDTINKIKSGLKEILDVIIEKFKEIYEKIKTSLKEAYEFISSWFKDVISKMKQWGENIITGLWDGLKSAWESIKNWVEDKFGWLGDMVSKIVEKVGNIKLAVSDAISINGSHANGLDYVPYNGYLAQLHKGERVLTKEENEEYSRGGASNGNSGDVYNFYNTKPDPREYARQMKQAKKELLFD